MITFETKRLLFRPLRSSDLDDLFALYKDAKLMKYITGAPRDYQTTQQRLKVHIVDHEVYGFGLYATILRSTGEFIGRCGIEPRDIENQLHGDIAWMFKQTHWGQGLATEFGQAMLDHSFTHFPIHRIYATAHPENTASIKVMQKIGMEYVRTTENRVLYEIWHPLVSVK